MIPVDVIHVSRRPFATNKKNQVKNVVGSALEADYWVHGKSHVFKKKRLSLGNGWYAPSLHSIYDVVHESRVACTNAGGPRLKDRWSRLLTLSFPALGHRKCMKTENV